jgi:hypothetical protein
MCFSTVARNSLDIVERSIMKFEISHINPNFGATGKELCLLGNTFSSQELICFILAINIFLLMVGKTLSSCSVLGMPSAIAILQNPASYQTSYIHLRDEHEAERLGKDGEHPRHLPPRRNDREAIR